MFCATPDCQCETRTLIHVNGEDVPICRHCLHIATVVAALAVRASEPSENEEDDS